MARAIFRIAANIIVGVGVALLIKTAFSSFNGDLARELFPDRPASAMANACAFGLSVPVPLHVMAVGLFLQLKQLSPGWRKTARFAVVISGLWLGLALAIKMVYI